MKIICVFTAAFLISVSCVAQQAKVVVFKHELRWTDENRFPNYFHVPAIRDSVFGETKLELMNYLKVSDVKLPQNVDYRVINGFGKQKLELPSNTAGKEPIIGISSFITRATSGYAIFWNLHIIIKEGNKIILEKEVSHELEYVNVSGYTSSIRWMSAKEFQETYKRLLREALGMLPASDEKIILGAQEASDEDARFLLYQQSKEQESSALLSDPERNLLKINGAWLSSGNFAAILTSADDTIFRFNYKDGYTWDLPKPSLGAVFATLFTETTGIGIEYDQKVISQKKGTLFFEDGQKFGIKMKWIQLATRSTLDDYASAQLISPLVAELYDEKVQVGYFLYTRVKESTTDITKENLNGNIGNRNENTADVDLIHRIKGSISDNPIFAEYNESKGIIQIKSGDELLGVMVVLNCNPLSRSIGNVHLSKNKLFMTSSSQNIFKPSLENDKSVEWYPLYFSGNASADSRKRCIETLICLFFGIGNM